MLHLQVTIGGPTGLKVFRLICRNATQYNQLSTGLQEAQLLAEHARDHTLRFGSKSPFFRKYFGNDTASAEVVGHFENVVGADKSSILFLCDDLDDKCKNDGWAGYWRGSNHSDQTIICDLSFVTRRYLTQLCSSGYTVSKSKTNIFGQVTCYTDSGT